MKITLHVNGPGNFDFYAEAHGRYVSLWIPRYWPLRFSLWLGRKDQFPWRIIQHLSYRPPEPKK